MLTCFKNKINGFIVKCFFILSCSINANANAAVPEGFEELVMAREEVVELYVYPEKKRNISARFIVEGNFIKLLDDASDLNLGLSKTLSLTKDGSNLVVEKLTGGIKSSPFCQGFREECVIIPDDLEIVYIDELKKIVLFVSPELMSPIVGNEKKFITPEIGERALITNNTFNYSATSSKDISYLDSYSYSNESYLGLNNESYFKADLNVSSSNGLSVEDVSYNYISGQNKYKVGYQTNVEYWNSTDSLDSFNNFSSYSISTGSTNELRTLKQEDFERFYFSSPRSGRLEVKNEQGRVLISRNINSGPQYISYYDLPRGTYNVKVKVYEGEDLIFEEDKLIVNYNDLYSMVGDLDYKINIGYLSDELTNTSFDNARLYENYESSFFSDGRLWMRVFDYLSIGGGFFSTSSDFYSYAGFNYDISESTSLLFNGGIFSNNDSFFLTQFRWGSFNLSWRRFNDNNGERNLITLSDVLFYDNDYENINLNYYYNINNNNSIYVSMIYNSTLVDDYFSSLDSLETKSFKVGYSRYNLPFNSKFTLDIGVSDSEQYDVGMTLSVPINANNNYSHNTYYNTKGNEFNSINHRENINSYWVNDKEKTISTNIGLYHSPDRDTQSLVDMSASMSTTDEIVKSSSYIYANSDGSMSANVFLDSNMIVTKDEILLTSNKSNSYFVSKNSTGDLVENGKFSPVIQEYVNDEVGRTILLENELEVQSLKNYQKYSFNVDQSSSDFYNDGEGSVEATSFPGTLIRLDTKVGELKSFISTFVDIKGRPIDSVECVGLGCVDVEKLVEGVYQFKVKETLPYKIISRKAQCVMPSLKMAKSSNLGENFCMPSFEDSYSDYQIAKFSDDDFYYFIGKFSDSSIIDRYRTNFLKDGVNFIEKEVNEFTYIFINSNRLLVKSELVDLNEMMSFAIESGAEPYVSN